jgi:hypothetical protein
MRYLDKDDTIIIKNESLLQVPSQRPKLAELEAMHRRVTNRLFTIFDMHPPEPFVEDLRFRETTPDPHFPSQESSEEEW